MRWSITRRVAILTLLCGLFGAAGATGADPAAAASVSSVTTSQPSAGAAGPGTAISDSATVKGLALLPPTGTVTFSICGPLSSAAGCASGGAPVGDPVPVATNALLGTSAASSIGFTPTQAGTWCFRADYSGDGNYFASSDGSAGECVTVTAAASTTTSTPAQPGITLGAANGDTATVTGTSSAGTPTGTVAFSVCGPLATPSGCASGAGTPVGAAVALAPSGTGSATAASSNFTPSAPGTWCFRADYSGDGNYSGSGDGSSNECFTVAKATASVVSSPAVPTTVAGGSDSDHVVVTGNPAGGSPGGTVSFFACGPLAPGATGCPSGGQPVGGGPVALSPGPGNSATADSPGFVAPQAGTWCFRAEYSGDGNYSASSDGSAGECVTVSAAASATSSTPTQPGITLGAVNGDTVTVTGNSGAGNPTGTVAFSVCGPLTTASGCAVGAGRPVGAAVALTPSGTESATAASSGFTPTAAGTWCFRADYSGDASYSGSGDGSSSECFSVARATPAISSAPAGQTVTAGGSDSDHVVLTGNPAGGSPGGTVSFFACGPLAPGATGCPSGGQLVGGGPVALSAGAGNTATADSPGFVAPQAGTWCFRAEYSGDGNYGAVSEGSAAGCFTSVPPGAPTASITAPTDSATYAVGQQVPVAYSCTDADGGPAASCTGSVPAGAPLDTSAHGHYTFTVTATGRNGESTAVSVAYSVAGPPTVVISSPKDGGVYTRGQSVGVNFGCSDDQFGPGLADCSAPLEIDTSHVGTFTFTATARSVDGQTGSGTVRYRVAYPSNRFRIYRLRARRDGRISLRVSLPGPGTLSIAESAGAPSFRLSRLQMKARRAGTIAVMLQPGARGRAFLARRRTAVGVRLAITYTPAGGVARTMRLSVRVPAQARR